LVFIAATQPSLGIDPGERDGDVIAAHLYPNSPLPANMLGAKIISIQAADQAAILLSPSDLIEEPDTLGDFERIKAFYAKQDRLFQSLSNGWVSIEYSFGETKQKTSVPVRENRPIAEFPFKFWTQLFVGLVGLTIGAWVVCARPADFAAWMVLVTGIGLALSSGAAALYSSREIALSYRVFSTASQINSIGTLLFGIGMLTLFLNYPRSFLPKAIVLLPVVCIGTVILTIQFVDWPRYLANVGDAAAVIMLALLVAIAAQIIVNRRDPTARAMLGWLGLSVALGAGGFVLTVMVPTLLGQDLWLEQSTAFLFFLLIYAGIALGVVRYRLFDLASWSISLLFYGFGVALLLLLDAALIYGLSVERAPAFGIALAAIGLAYLPLRNRAGQWLRRNKEMPAEELYRRITEISYAAEPINKLALLRLFWSDLFSPLSIEFLPDYTQSGASLEANGAEMVVAPVLGMPALRMAWAEQGSRLFSSQDLQRANSVNALIHTSLQQNRTYVEAVSTERSRINRDMHDNIGILLVSALHSDSADRKDTLIRQTLSDLREIISNPIQSRKDLVPLIADLRAEISSHLEAAKISVEWQYENLPNVSVSTAAVHALRSLLREGVNNVIRHSGAQTVTIHLAFTRLGLCVLLQDDGHGFDREKIDLGNGIKNLSNRIEQLGGGFDLVSGSSGTTMSATLSLGTAFERDEM
jgi:signal transduction histidine kinase